MPVLEAFKAWLDELAPKVLPQSLLGKAIAYTRNQWECLGRYVTDGRAPIDNHVCERDIRPFATSRKSWLFSDTVDGAKASATIYSLVLTCRACGVERPVLPVAAWKARSGSGGIAGWSSARMHGLPVSANYAFVSTGVSTFIVLCFPWLLPLSARASLMTCVSGSYCCAALRKFMHRCNNLEINVAINTQSHINTSEPHS
ncbi:hypothetical protein QFZ89_007742 [Paraburkholderia youngii]